MYGELLDLEGALGADEWRDPAAVSEEVLRRYERLWAELTGEEEFAAGDRHRVEERLRRLNELGFDVEELELLARDGRYTLRVPPHVVEPGHHRRRLLRLTGLDAQENQARRLLDDVAAYRSRLEQAGERLVSDAAAAGRWLADVFEPAIAAVPIELHRKRDAAQLFHELLDHRSHLSDTVGRDVALGEAVGSYVDTVLTAVPDERATLVRGQDVRPQPKASDEMQATHVVASGSAAPEATHPVRNAAWLTCLVRGHRWDVAPYAGARHMTCVRCGMTAEPVWPG